MTASAAKSRNPRRVRCPECGALLSLDEPFDVNSRHAVIRSGNAVYIFCPKSKIPQD